MSQATAEIATSGYIGGMNARTIQFVDDLGRRDDQRPTDEGPTVEFVGGPRDGDRETVTASPAQIDASGGSYRRSVRCADDGALRYVFEPDPLFVTHKRSIRPG